MNGRDRENPPGGSTPQRHASDEQFEELLARALRIDVPEAMPATGARRSPPMLRWAALAAGLLMAVGLSVRMLQNIGYIGTGDLGHDVVAHIHHEPSAVRIPVVPPEAAVPQAELETVLREAGANLGPMRPMVRYAKLCPFRGEMVAHFVVQGASGPVTVLLLPDEEVERPLPVDEDGFIGTIVSLPIGGSIAVVGEQGEARLDEIQREVAAAVRWRL
jgi:hypothetical protein